MKVLLGTELEGGQRTAALTRLYELCELCELSELSELSRLYRSQELVEQVCVTG